MKRATQQPAFAFPSADMIFWTDPPFLYFFLMFFLVAGIRIFTRLCLLSANRHPAKALTSNMARSRVSVHYGPYPVESQGNGLL